MPASLPPSRPLITLTGTLQTDLAQRVYRKYGEHLLRELLFFSSTLPFLRTQGDSSDAAAGVDDSLAAVDELLTTALTELSNRHETVAQQLRQQGATPPTYSQPLSYAMAITSPRGRRFLEVLQTADRYAQQVDGLWLCEALDDLARAGALLWARRHLVKVAVGIVQLGARTHALSWFYQQEAGILKQLADAFQNEQLAWGRDGYLYRPSTDEEARVALRFPLAVPDDADQQVLVASWAERGWLRTRTPQTLAPDLRLLVLSREVSGHFLVAAGVSRSQRRRLAEQHRALLLARLTPEALLRHADIRVTERVYAHLLPDQLKVTVQVLDRHDLVTLDADKTHLDRLSG